MGQGDGKVLLNCDDKGVEDNSRRSTYRRWLTLAINSSVSEDCAG
jgi:hypothetical protein